MFELRNNKETISLQAKIHIAFLSHPFEQLAVKEIDLLARYIVYTIIPGHIKILSDFLIPVNFDEFLSSHSRASFHVNHWHE